MGNSLGPEENPIDDYPLTLRKLLKEYLPRESHFDDRFGNITLFTHIHSANDLILVKDKWLNTLGDAQELHNFIKTRTSISHISLAK